MQIMDQEEFDSDGFRSDNSILNTDWIVDETTSGMSDTASRTSISDDDETLEKGLERIFPSYIAALQWIKERANKSGFDVTTRNSHPGKWYELKCAKGGERTRRSRIRLTNYLFRAILSIQKKLGNV